MKVHCGHLLFNIKYNFDLYVIEFMCINLHTFDAAGCNVIEYFYSSNVCKLIEVSYTGHAFVFVHENQLFLIFMHKSHVDT